MTDDEFPALVDSRKACEILFGSNERKNVYRLYAMIERGDIAARKLGDRWFIPGHEMERFTTSQNA